MKAMRLKNLCAMASLLVGLGALSSAHADFYFGTLGAAASATDVYAMTCPLLPVTALSAQANVDDQGGADGIVVSVQVVNPHGRAANATAPDGGGVSPTVGLSNQPGNYLILVDKDAAGAQNYYLNLDCYDAGNVALVGTQSWLVQNQ
jgi:hypothetical protein